MKKHLSILLRIAISLFLIGLLVYMERGELPEIKQVLLSFNFYYFIFALVVLLLGTYISSIRWKVILSTSKIEISTIHLFILYLKGYFYNNFLPTSMGGDVYKSISLGRNIKSHSTALFSVFMDRFSGLIVLVLLALFGLGSQYGIIGVLAALGLLIFGLLLYFPTLNLFANKIKFFKKFKEASDLFIQDKRTGLRILLLSLLVQSFSFATTYILFLGFGTVLDFKYVLSYFPITSLSLLIPSINGLGSQDWTYKLLFERINLGDIAISTSLVFHVLRLIMSLIGGVLILLKIENINYKFNTPNFKRASNSKL